VCERCSLGCCSTLLLPLLPLLLLLLLYVYVVMLCVRLGVWVRLWMASCKVSSLPEYSGGGG